MKKRVRLKVTTIRQQRLAADPTLRLRCPVCGYEVEMLTGVQAVGILEVDRETLDELVAGGQVHAVQTVSGSLRLCKDSLFL